MLENLGESPTDYVKLSSSQRIINDLWTALVSLIKLKTRNGNGNENGGTCSNWTIRIGSHSTWPRLHLMHSGINNQKKINNDDAGWVYSSRIGSVRTRQRAMQIRVFFLDSEEISASFQLQSNRFKEIQFRSLKSISIWFPFLPNQGRDLQQL